MDDMKQDCVGCVCWNEDSD